MFTCAHDNSISGFLELLEDNFFKSYRLVYVVLLQNIIQIYSDEMQNTLLKQHELNSKSCVEMLSPDHPNNKFWIMSVYQVDDPGGRVILVAQDATNIEAWMLTIIQEIRGPYKSSENFDGDFVSRVSSSQDHVAIGDMHASSVMSGYLMKQSSGAIKNWKTR